MKDKEIFPTHLSTTCVVNTDFSINFFLYQSIIFTTKLYPPF